MILSTTLAESSLTIKEVDIVLDFCLVRIPIFNAHTQVGTVATTWCSQASCTQRKGRTGRVGPGQVIRMMPKAAWDWLRPFSVPEILSGDLESVVLAIKQSPIFGAGVKVEEVTQQLVDSPDVESIRATKARLTSVGAFTADETLTPLGKPKLRVSLSIPRSPATTTEGVHPVAFACVRACVRRPLRRAHEPPGVRRAHAHACPAPRLRAGGGAARRVPRFARRAGAAALCARTCGR